MESRRPQHHSLLVVALQSFSSQDKVMSGDSWASTTRKTPTLAVFLVPLPLSGGGGGGGFKVKLKKERAAHMNTTYMGDGGRGPHVTYLGCMEQRHSASVLENMNFYFVGRWGLLPSRSLRSSRSSRSLSLITFPMDALTSLRDTRLVTASLQHAAFTPGALPGPRWSHLSELLDFSISISSSRSMQLLLWFSSAFPPLNLSAESSERENEAVHQSTTGGAVTTASSNGRCASAHSCG